MTKNSSSGTENLRLIAALRVEAEKRGIDLPDIRFDEADAFLLFQEKYRYDPKGFVRDCIIWDDGESPKPYQDEALDKLIEEKRISLRGPHGLGKSALAAWIVIWAILVFDDVKVPTTASAWRQLTKYLWPEIHKWVGKLNWEKISRGPFNERSELLVRSLKRSATCEAFALASKATSAELLEGAHAKVIVYVFDESKSIPNSVWDAAEGAFSQAGGDTKAEAYAVAISTPGAPSGRFYDIHSKKPGFSEWWVRHITKEEVIAAGMMSREWADNREDQWGKDSAVFQNRVLGEFAQSGEDSIIPLAHVELANQRWLKWSDAGKPDSGGRLIFGCDIARYGEDKSCVGEKKEYTILRIDKWGKKSTMETVGRIKVRLIGNSKAYIDVIGIGAGVVDRLKEIKTEEDLDYSIFGVNFANKTDKTDSTGMLKMLNVRAAAWWKMRELLDPESGFNVRLPPDDDLTGDLTTPRWSITSSGKVKVESKDDIRSRLGRSPDVGDAVVLAFWGSGEGQTMKDWLEEKEAEKERKREAFLGEV